MGTLEFVILLGLLGLAAFTLIMNVRLDNDQDYYKCFMKRFYKNKASFETGCEGDGKECKHCPHFKKFKEVNKDVRGN